MNITMEKWKGGKMDWDNINWDQLEYFHLSIFKVN